MRLTKEGRKAPLSPSSIERLRGKWVAEFDAWSRRSLRGVEPIYLWADGIYVKAGLEKDKAALLVIVAGLRDGRKVVLAVESGYRESAEAWGDTAPANRSESHLVQQLFDFMLPAEAPQRIVGDKAYDSDALDAVWQRRASR